jgi:uncharacterized membrane protein
VNDPQLSPRRTDRARRIALILLAGLILAYAVFFGLLTVRKHNAFQTTAFDLGNVDQAVWNTRHGRPLAMTNIEGLTNRLGTHVEPILLPISLLYVVWSDPRLLLLLQSLVVALGAWPVYLIGRHVLHDIHPMSPGVQYGIPLLFALVYLLFPALQSANTFDFHAVTLAPTFFLFAFYFLETERWGGYALFGILTMSCKEDMPLLVMMLGLYALLVRRRWVVGLATMAVAGGWFLVAVGWIMPYFDTRGVSPLANRYAYLGDSPLEIALTVLTRPGLVLEHLSTAENLAYLRDLLAPLAFLSLLAPQVLVLGLLPLLINLLSTEGTMQQLEGFHYAAPLVAPVVVAAIYGVAWLIRRFPRFRVLPVAVAMVVLAASLLYHYGHGYTPLAADFGGTWPVVTDHHRLGEEMVGDIPTQASLAALPHPNPHASQRQALSMIDRVEGGLLAPLNEAEYVWLDVTNGWPLHPKDLKAGVDALLAGDYGLARAVDGWLLLRRDAPDVALPAAFYEFARVADPQPQYPMQLQFYLEGEPVLECLGFDLDRQGTESSLRFYWRSLQPLPPDLRLYPFFFDDASGEILEDTRLRPMIGTVWYPPDRWQVGEVVSTSTLPWDVGDTYSVGLGVMQGDDWAEVDRRLPIRVESSYLVVRLFDGDTWVRLLHVEAGEAMEEIRRFGAPAPEVVVDAEFGAPSEGPSESPSDEHGNGLIRLVGYDLDCNRRQAACGLDLYWQALERMEGSYTVFAQLLDPTGAVRAQWDSSPQDGGYPTQWWLPSEVILDPVSLQLATGAPRGVAYRLIAGLYDPATGNRLPVVGTGADHVELATIDF